MRAVPPWQKLGLENLVARTVPYSAFILHYFLGMKAETFLPPHSYTVHDKKSFGNQGFVLKVFLQSNIDALPVKHPPKQAALKTSHQQNHRFVEESREGRSTQHFFKILLHSASMAEIGS